MGQKVHPKSLRIKIIHPWESNWFSSDLKAYAKNVKEDFVIRDFVKRKLKSASVSRIEIDRKAQKLIVRIVTGRSGVVVGRGGQGVDQLRKNLQLLTGRKDIQLDVIEVARVDAEAQLVAESIATQLEKRVAYRRAMKQVIQRAQRAGVKGIKIMVSGRLGGAEIARTEWTKEGQIPLHTFRADIDYGFAESKTVFGIIGVKVWIFRGEVLPGEMAQPNIKSRTPDSQHADSQTNASSSKKSRPRRVNGPSGSHSSDKDRSNQSSRNEQSQAKPSSLSLD
ncbi:MAG: 30S ribosomal protein S3 [Candidatus Melainabacteria bacterium]|nr:30S ribosomal protein S3 [Candidatus Melainabacteria bacterium]